MLGGGAERTDFTQKETFFVRQPFLFLRACQMEFDTRLLPGVILASLYCSPKIQHGVSGRNGWISPPPYTLWRTHRQ